MVSGTFLSYPKYAIDLLDLFQMIDCKPLQIPFQSKVKLVVDCDTPLVDATLSCQIVGTLIYLTHRRHNISFMINKVQRFMQKPHEIPWKGVKTILIYLQGTLHYVVLCSSRDTILFVCYIDNDQVGDNLNKRSIIGYIFNLGLVTISWSCKKLRTLSLSSYEAKYSAYKDEANEVVQISQVLKDIVLVQKYPIELICDNHSAIKIVHDSLYHSKTKYNDLDTYCIQYFVANGVKFLEFCLIEKKVVDSFTKSTTKEKFMYLHKLLGTREVVIKEE